MGNEVQAQRGRTLFGGLAVALTTAALAAPTALGASLGFFEPASSPEPAGTTPRAVAIADLDLDGDPDLAVANAGSNDVTILLNHGNASFRQPRTSPAPAGDVPVAIAAADLDGDGDPDLAVVNETVDQLTILLNNGRGAFHQARSGPIPVGAEPEGVAIVDLNGDGDQDLVVANSLSDDVTILFNNGAGKFHQPRWSPKGAGSGPSSIAAGDFDGDKDQDLAVTDFDSDELTILLNNGSGHFSHPATSPEQVGDAPVAIVAANLHGGPFDDLAVANLLSADVTILESTRGGDFVERRSSPVTVGGRPASLAAADFDVDGDQDLAVANSNSNDVTILGNNGLGRFRPPPSSPHPTGDSPSSVAAANLDGGFGQDLAIANEASDNVTILRHR